jgi:hypothetical protein
MAGLAAQVHGGHVDAAGHDQAQRVDQRVVGGALGHEAHGAEVDRLDHVAGAIRGRDHHHRQCRMGLAHLDEHVEAARVAQLQVEQHQVEVRVGRERGTRRTRAANGRDLHVRIQFLDHGLQRRQDQRVVIDQQHLHEYPLRLSL